MKKNKLLFLFLLPCMLGFAQTEYFNPLDELGSGYGTRDIPPIKDHEINFPSSSQEVTPTNNSRKVNRKASSEEIHNAFEQELRAIEQASQTSQANQTMQASQDNNEYAKVSSFDVEATNFERFQNSPCYDEIGFNPTWDLTNLEKTYTDCESKKNIKTAMNALYILAFAVIIGIVIYFSRKKNS